MVEINIGGFTFDLSGKRLLFHFLLLYLAVLVIAVWVWHGHNWALACFVGIAGALGFLQEEPVSAMTPIWFLPLCGGGFGALAIVYEVKKRRCGRLAAVVSVGLWGSLAYLTMLMPLWLEERPWLLPR